MDHFNIKHEKCSNQEIVSISNEEKKKIVKEPIEKQYGTNLQY